jgi:hypothetical protein
MRVKTFRIPYWWCIHLHRDVIETTKPGDEWDSYEVGKPKAYLQLQVRLPMALFRLLWKARQWHMKRYREFSALFY